MRKVTLLFDYEGFRREVHPLIQQADVGNFDVVIEQARTISRNISTKQWILDGLGTSLLQFEELLPGPSLVGFSFLVLLSQFLRSNPFAPNSIEGISSVVPSLGWSQRDASLLRDGMATTTLLKPELVLDPLERPSPADERWHKPAFYWWWLRPANAYKTGWLNKKQIEEFYHRLLEVQTNFEQIDVTRLNIHRSKTRVDLLVDYQQGLKLLETAIREGFGLFYNLS